MTTVPIPQLAEALQRGNLAVFLGGDLPREATGLPSRADLAAALAGRLGLGGPPPPWPEIAAQYEASAGKNALISWLWDQLEPSRHRPGSFYGLLAQLPAKVFITTTYDTCLYDALRAAGRQPNVPVVDAASLGLLDAGRPTVVKLFGVYDRPKSLVLTATQLRQLPQTKAQLLSGLVHPTLANQGVLILGQDLRDSYFQTMHQTALFQAGTIRPRAFAAWQGLAEWEQRTWLEQEVRVLDAPALELLGRLAGDVEAAPVADSSPAPLEVGTGRPSPPLQPGRPRIDPDNPPLAAIRDLLEAAFTAKTLKRFCQDRPDFRPLVTRFSPAGGLSDGVDRVIDYCGEFLLWDELLAEVEQENPKQYERFEPRLYGQDSRNRQ